MKSLFSRTNRNRPEKRPLRLGRWVLKYAIRLTVLFLLFFIMFSISGCLERLFYVPMGDPGPTPDGYEEVWFNSADGTHLHGWFMPALTDEPNPATILVVHGNAGNISNHSGFVDFLPEYGYNVFLFDYRSYGKSERDRLRRTYLYEDTQAALDYLLTQRSDIDSERIMVFGQSLGAVFAVRLMADRPEIRAGVFMSAFSNWRTIAASTVSFNKANPGPVSRFLARMLIPSGLDAIDAITRIGPDRPILLVHGTSDRITPYEHSKQLLEVGQSVNLDIRLYTIPDGDHNNLRWDDVNLDEEISGFYDGAV